MTLSPTSLAFATRMNLGLERLSRYTAEAAMQRERIWDTHRRAVAARANNEFARFRQLEDECGIAMHFYFICWDAVAKTLASLRQPDMGVASTQRVYALHQTVLKQYQNARNQFEHYDERLPLGSRSQDEYTRTDNGQSLCYELPYLTPDGCVQYYSNRWDVSSESLALLRNIVEAFRHDLRDELCVIARRTMGATGTNLESVSERGGQYRAPAV